MTWGRVTLRAGSLHSICEMSSLRAGDTAGLLGKAMGCVRMTLYSPMMLGCLNGTVPAETSNWYVILLASHGADCVFGRSKLSSEMKQEVLRSCNVWLRMQAGQERKHVALTTDASDVRWNAAMTAKQRP